MTKIRLTQLFTDENFELFPQNEKLIFVSKNLLKQDVKIENKAYKLICPIKKIVILFDHIFQSTNIELLADDDTLLLHLPVENLNLEDVIIEYEIYDKSQPI